jgi:Flp pilus assembly protein TadG
MTLRPALTHRTSHGLTILLVIVLMTVLLGLVAMAVDYGYLRVVKSELQTTIDAANLAGASGLPISPAEARQRAIDIAKENTVNGQPLVLTDRDIELGTWDPDSHQFTALASDREGEATAIRVTGRLNAERGNALNLIFAPMIGVNTANVAASAVAGFGQGADVVIVQDVTSSFAEEIADAKVADQALIDALNSNGVGRSSIGIVAHTGWGKTISPLRGVRNHYNSLTQAVSSLQLCGTGSMPVCSGTDPAAGLEEGIKVFNDPNYLPTASSVKALVLVSDGEPNVDPAGSHPALNNDQLLTLAQQRADEAWEQGIHVYVVFFNRANDPVAANRLRTLSRGKGDFVQVTDAKKLPDAMEDVTRKLPVQLLK